MNIAINRPFLSSTPLQMIVEILSEHQVAAWTIAFPDCRVVAESRELAIVALEERLKERMNAIEVIDFPGKTVEHPALKFAGVFKDDPDFIMWHDRFWADKQNPAFDDEHLSVEELMELL